MIWDRHEQRRRDEKLENITATLCTIDLPTVTALVGDCMQGTNASNLVSAQIMRAACAHRILSQHQDGACGRALTSVSMQARRFLARSLHGDSRLSAKAGTCPMPKWDTTSDT